ncbi:ATP-binding protein [Deminuibacter soli]|uniref:histidine kinase n=1 Tax=Deminuibacter soli TaxID=2291815 RepID=A0A3E1NIK0_9BACT|nr:ATP-binding protein [Deminuibacter soli]RFM27763.1 GHKL domain-containing protein [Deminuibacter soli]
MAVTIEQLQQIEALADVPAPQLQWLIDQGEEYWLEKGDKLFSIGDHLDKTHVFLEGKIRLCAMQQGVLREVYVYDKAHVAGYLPFSRLVTVKLTCEILQRSHFLSIPGPIIREAIKLHYELTAALVGVMTNRVRDYTAFQQQTEKMISLGKLSAGLAHELNNPAAAIARTSGLLQTQVELLTELFKPLSQLQLTAEQVETLDKKINTLLCNRPMQIKSMLEQAAVEDALYNWMEEEELDVNAGELSANFAEAGIATADLDEIKACAPVQYLPLLLQWMNNGAVALKMAADIREASERISNLVNSVKNYTQMDRDGNLQPTDIHTGLRNTLTMLDYKLRKGNVTVEEHFDLTLPQLDAYPGELNQVWTNIIDNAIDAMAVNKEGVLRITTQQDNEFIEVTINDNGPGIPQEILANVFDPFFTTKEVGKGTGLGLDIVNRIMRQHKGTVRLRSQPGSTSFTLCFPIHLQ